MIDLHCHILPGLDDGPDTLAEAVEMCRMAYHDGIRTIVATPHCRPGRFACSDAQAAEKMNVLQGALLEQDIGVRILRGADVTITPEVPSLLKAERHLTLNGTGRYFLAEFPHDAVPPGWERFCLSLLHQGLRPIITHPERNPWFAAHPDALYPFVMAGGMLQITAMSLTNEYGPAAHACAAQLLHKNMVHIIASDAHSSTHRPPLLSRAVAEAARIVGSEKATALVTSIPQAVIEGRLMDMEGPQADVPRKRTWIQKITRL